MALQQGRRHIAFAVARFSHPTPRSGFFYHFPALQSARNPPVGGTVRIP